MRLRRILESIQATNGLESLASGLVVGDKQTRCAHRPARYDFPDVALCWFLFVPFLPTMCMLLCLCLGSAYITARLPACPAPSPATPLNTSSPCRFSAIKARMPVSYKPSSARLPSTKSCAPLDRVSICGCQSDCEYLAGPQIEAHSHISNHYPRIITTDDISDPTTRQRVLHNAALALVRARSHEDFESHPADDWIVIIRGGNVWAICSLARKQQFMFVHNSICKKTGTSLGVYRGHLYVTSRLRCRLTIILIVNSAVIKNPQFDGTLPEFPCYQFFSTSAR